MTAKYDLNILDFARLVGDGRRVTDQEYVDHMRRVLPLDDLRNINPSEATSFLMAMTWLYDLAILVWEANNKQLVKGQEAAGSLCLPGGSGPWIKNMLTRGVEPADFTPLEHYNVGREID